MDLSRVKGLGPTKVEALRAAGITTAHDLAQIDLRKTPDVDGVSRDALKAYKQRARQLLQREGIEFDKAPYGTNQAQAGRPTKPAKPAAARAPNPAPEPTKKRGFLGRLFSKS